MKRHHFSMLAFGCVAVMFMISPIFSENITNCVNCELIMSLAKYHFHNNITDKTKLRIQLNIECLNLAVESSNATTHCQAMVRNNIDKIYDDLHDGVSSRNTCVDIGECDPFPTTPTAGPMKKFGALWQNRRNEQMKLRRHRQR